MRGQILAALVALALAGCSAREVELEPEWAPLRRVVEMGAWPADRATTIGETVYLADLDWWHETYPPGPRRKGFLLHEREHALQQQAMGVLAFVARYGTDPRFMWEVESRAWALELQHLHALGLPVNAKAVARALAGYETPDGRAMVEEGAALAFVLDVLAGRWNP